MSAIYLASSWRNEHQPDVLDRLREAGHLVYDFRNPGDSWAKPRSGDDSGGFRWSDIDQQWERWTPWAFTQALDTDTAARGFANDWDAMEQAEVGVLLLPCGRSAHLEAGYFTGRPEKTLHILALELPEPELMYLMADEVHLTVESLLEGLCRL
jgi:hypothetical protein